MTPPWIEPVTLGGRAVRLEPLAQRHATALGTAAADAEVWRWMQVDGSRPELFDAWIADALAAGARGHEVPFATLDAATGQPIGSTRFLALAPEHRRVEIGSTWIVRGAWGGGANVEAKLLMLEHAFERLGCLRVEFKTDARNQRSRRALEALGTTFEGIHRRHMLVQGGRRRDSAWYSVIADEWDAVRSRLELRLAASSRSRACPERARPGRRADRR